MARRYDGLKIKPIGIVLCLGLMFATSCGTEPLGQINHDQTNQTKKDDSDTNTKELYVYSAVLSVDRSLTPWSSNNQKTLSDSGVIYLPNELTLTGFSASGGPQGGWVDVVAAGTVYCYQRNNNQNTYALRYRKIAGATTGCDGNNDKVSGSFDVAVHFNGSAVLQVIPRDPKLAGAVVEATFTIAGLR